MKLNNARLITPISHARIANVQRPDAVLSQFFTGLAALIAQPTNDVDIVFTSGLYQNNPNNDPQRQRMGLLQREAEWRNRFDKIIDRQNPTGRINGFDLKPEGFAMVSWDENITRHWNEFSDNLNKLNKAYREDIGFGQSIDDALKAMSREPTDYNLKFIFEEIAVTALWLKGQSVTKKRLRESDAADGVYIVYPGDVPDFMAAGLNCLFKQHKNLLPLIWINTEKDQPQIHTRRFGKDAPVKGESLRIN